MPKFTVNAARFDPYRNFKFRVKWSENGYIAGVSKVSALKRATEIVEHREGGDPSSGDKSPDRTKYEAITMERGVTHDPEFEAWANKVWNCGRAQVPADQRRNLTIDVFNEAGQRMLSYKVYRAWVSEFTAQADLDANANAAQIESIKIEHEGWERDTSVPEASEPQADDGGA